MPTSRKTFVRQTALCLAFATVTAFTVPSALALPRWQYVREVSQALPSGLNFSSAPAPVFQEAVQRVVLAHPASEAPAIAGALAKAAPLERAKEIADAIGKLFPNHPALSAQVVEIAREMTIALNQKNGIAVAGDGKGIIEPDFKNVAEPVSEAPTMDAVATEIGSTAATLAYYLDPLNPGSEALIIQLIQGVVLINPQLDYTAKIVEIFISTLRTLGVTDDILDNIEKGVLDVIDNEPIRKQIRETLKRLKADDVMFPPGFIIRHETPVTNG